MAILDNLLGIVVPHDCVGCGREPRLLCTDCCDSLPAAVSRCYRCHQASPDWRTCQPCRRESKLFAVMAAARYQAAAERLVRKLKYGQAVAAARDIAERLVPLAPNDSGLIITYLPTAASRARGRGFDQARLIARQLSQLTGLPFTSFLVRLGQARQVGANRQDRFAQTADMFRARNRSLLAGATVILVDDVITTGASLEAAAAVLRANGARRVYGLVFCQA